MLRNLRARFRRLPDNPYWVKSRDRTPAWKLAMQWLAAAFLAPTVILLAYWDAPPTIAKFGAVMFFGLIVLSVCVRASYATSLWLVSERQKETLLPLALTRLDSADIADGVAFATLRPLARQVAMAIPSLLALAALGGMPAFAFVFFVVQLVLLGVIQAYYGLGVSASAQNSRQATLRAVMVPGFILLVLPFFFCFGGCLALPLWLVHPFFAFGLSWAGYDLPFSGLVSVFFWKGWVLLSVLGYLGLALALRNQAIEALGRARLF